MKATSAALSNVGARRVAVFTAVWHHAGARLEGIFRYAREKAWDVRVVDNHEDGVSMTPTDVVRNWRPDGCIVDGDLVHVPRRFGIPVVHCDADPRRMRRPWWGVAHDSRESVRLALGELLALELPAYAFAGFYVARRWSRERRAVFRREMAQRRLPAHVLSDGDGDYFGWERRLAAWIASLPRPCGILAANDRVGVAVLDICRSLGIVVPESIAVAGVDNDEAFCESAVPSLTSAMPDYAESGYRAAEMLDERMEGRCPKPEVRVFPTTCLVRRQSTRVIGAGGLPIRKAVETIRRRACEGLGAAEVAAEIGGSRRSAERRFRTATGRTILDEILDVRLRRAQELLRDPRVLLKNIHYQCGYEDDMAFRRFFRQKTGISVSEWRRRNAPH